jgi:hypothetical protein
VVVAAVVVTAPVSLPLLVGAAAVGAVAGAVAAGALANNDNEAWAVGALAGVAVGATAAVAGGAGLAAVGGGLIRGGAAAAAAFGIIGPERARRIAWWGENVSIRTQIATWRVAATLRQGGDVVLQQGVSGTNAQQMASLTRLTGNEIGLFLNYRNQVVLRMGTPTQIDVFGTRLMYAHVHPNGVLELSGTQTYWNPATATSPGFWSYVPPGGQHTGDVAYFHDIYNLYGYWVQRTLLIGPNGECRWVDVPPPFGSVR